MLRLNLFLLVLAVVCALSVVTSQHKARRLPATSACTTPLAGNFSPQCQQRRSIGFTVSPLVAMRALAPAGGLPES